MAEQYIYSRAEKEFTNALNQTIPRGFGFMALSPGMNNALKQDVKVHCEDCPRLSQKDSQGIPLPLFRKTLLPKGQVLLQQSTWIEKNGRDFYVAHGYVLDDEEVNVGPSKWLSAVFQLGDPNAAPEGIPSLENRLELVDKEIFHEKSLKETMDILKIDQTCFRDMLLACFDALAYHRRQVLIAWDFEQPEEQNMRCSVLYWIYTCLPHDLWIQLGFDSVYTKKSFPRLVQLAFVDKASIRDGGQAPRIQLGNQLLQLEGNFLVQDGEIIHNDGKYKTEWYHEDTVYARWLKQIINTLWECPEEELPLVTQGLAQFTSPSSSRCPRSRRKSG